ncbi:hypothetical protein MTR_8g079590 [Medicago truncatula]|uniref:Reverse transcriptase zinc-binding domain-containing protein n=1 Tax=Medicago truncatula TaxID=3880 RepID=G7LGC2_MEDTR|nr:hypothetical protein MTR_8g079590 [Medicago truncatula]
MDRLPTKENLANRGIIPVEGRLCATGCGCVQNVNHLFLSCPNFGALWPLVREWLGVEAVDPQHILDHFLQFIHYAGSELSQNVMGLENDVTNSRSLLSTSITSRNDRYDTISNGIVHKRNLSMRERLKPNDVLYQGEPAIANDLSSSEVHQQQEAGLL